MSLRACSSNHTTRSKILCPSSTWETTVPWQGRFQTRRPRRRAPGRSVWLPRDGRSCEPVEFDLRLDLQVDDAGHFRHQAAAMSSAASSQDRQSAAEELDGDLRPDARHDVIQTMRNGLADIAKQARHFPEHVADFCHHELSWPAGFFHAETV